jgi:peptidyl-prolyl cis-trans isomerase D
VKFTEYDKYIQKYSDYLVKSSFSNSLLAENEIANSNNVFNVEFVMVPFGFSRDTTITVSDEEIKAFYDNNKKLFKQEETRDIEYVVIEATPTAEDVEAVKAAFDEVYADFATSESVEAILSVNSEYKNSAWCKAGDLKFISEEAEAYAFSKGATISEVFADDKAYHAVRVLEAAGDSVKVAVLYKTINPSQETLDTYYAKAENILNLYRNNTVLAGTSNRQVQTQRLQNRASRYNSRPRCSERLCGIPHPSSRQPEGKQKVRMDSGYVGGLRLCRI